MLSDFDVQNACFHENWLFRALFVKISKSENAQHSGIPGKGGCISNG